MNEEFKNETLTEVKPEEVKNDLVPIENYGISTEDNSIGGYLLIGGAGLGLGYLLAKAIGKMKKKKIKKEIQQEVKEKTEEVEHCEGTVEDSPKKSDKKDK